MESFITNFEPTATKQNSGGLFRRNRAKTNEQPVFVTGPARGVQAIVAALGGPALLAKEGDEADDAALAVGTFDLKHGKASLPMQHSPLVGCTECSDSRAIVIVVDSTDREGVETIANAVSALLDTAPPSVPLLIWASKQEVPGAMIGEGERLCPNKEMRCRWIRQGWSSLQSHSLGETLPFLALLPAFGHRLMPLRAVLLQSTTWRSSSSSSCSRTAGRVAAAGGASRPAGVSWPTAAIPMDNPYCSCKRTRVRARCSAEAEQGSFGLVPGLDWLVATLACPYLESEAIRLKAGGSSHWRDCHFADAPSPSLLKHLLKVEGAAAE